MDDLHIVSLYLKRDEQALKETDDKYRRLCFSIAKNILADTEDCRECVNDTYMAVWNSIPPNKPDNFKAYIAKMLIERLLYHFYCRRIKECVGNKMLALDRSVRKHHYKHKASFIN